MERGKSKKVKNWKIVRILGNWKIRKVKRGKLEKLNIGKVDFLEEWKSE